MNKRSFSLNKFLTAIKTSFLAAFMLTFLTLFSAPLTLAGGQLVHLTADTEGWSTNSDLYGRVMRVSLNPDFPCKDTEITFRFIEPKDGDVVSTEDGGATYTGRENTTDYTTHCSTYAKLSSKVKGERLVTVDVKNGSRVWKDSPVIMVHFDGEYHPDNHYGQYAYSTPKGSTVVINPTPPTNPFKDGKIEVRLLNQEMVSNSTRVVTIKWGAFGGSPTTSKIYGSTDKTNWDFLVDDQRGPSASLKLTNQDYFIKLNGCVHKYGTCVDSNVLFIPKLNTDSGNVIITPPPSSSPSGVENDDLAQKVASLEAQLAESKKEQSILEQRVNDLVNFIKNLFPFFK